MPPDIKLLKDHNLKITRGREAILRMFTHSRNPLSLSADEICHRLRFYPKPNLATVYRVLALFEKKGILRRSDVGEPGKEASKRAPVFYELAE